MIHKDSNSKEGMDHNRDLVAKLLLTMEKSEVCSEQGVKRALLLKGGNSLFGLDSCIAP